jgi:hypothetical protein
LPAPAFARGAVIYIQELVLASPAFAGIANAGTEPPLRDNSGMQVRMKGYCRSMIKLILAVLSTLGILQYPTALQAAAIGEVTVITTGSIEQYAKFEVAFEVTDSTYTNPYLPYDTTPVPGLAPGSGVSVNAFFLTPSETEWEDAKRIGCFYYQPYDKATLVPQGAAHWRCRFTPNVPGDWQYKIQVTDRNGTVDSLVYRFTCIASARKGLIRVSAADPRFFEFSDGTPFVTPLVTVRHIRNQGNLAATIAKLGRNGIHFIRWFPNREEGDVNLFGDSIVSSWRYGGSYDAAEPDTVRGKTWSYSPYYYSGQRVYLDGGQTYQFSFRANVSGEQVLDAGVVGHTSLVVCSATNMLHTGCTAKASGWNSYSATFVAANTGDAELYIRGLYVGPDAPAPYNETRSGRVRINEVTLQRDERGNGIWGANMVTRGDADTHLYVDQNEAGIMDEIITYSEIYAVYHKLPIFHKNDGILNHYDAYGNLADRFQCDWGYCANHFYSGEGQMVRWLQRAYMRYFLARWSYSPAIHSLEYVNESDFYDVALEAGWMYAQYTAENSSRKILTTNSFWGYWIEDFFKDPTYGQYLDYSDKHWYANQDADDDEVISTIWDDTVANVRQCYRRFKQYAAQGSGYAKPFVRGETGVAVSGTEPVDPAIIAEVTGTYYHKKVWAHVGLLGYTCDGEWYPQIFEPHSNTAFPNSTYDIYKIYAAYDEFMEGEPLNNGTHTDVGTDLTGDSFVASSNPNLRAYGSKDPATARVLIWVDNKNNTWLNPNLGMLASGIITVTGVPPGSYTQETWNTGAGTYIKTEDAIVVGADGVLRFDVSTSKDVAFKFYQANYPSLRIQLYLPFTQHK